LLIGLYLLRGRARASSRSRLVNAVAVVTTNLLCAAAHNRFVVMSKGRCSTLSGRVD